MYILYYFSVIKSCEAASQSSAVETTLHWNGWPFWSFCCLAHFCNTHPWNFPHNFAFAKSREFSRDEVEISMAGCPQSSCNLQQPKFRSYLYEFHENLWSANVMWGSFLPWCSVETLQSFELVILWSMAGGLESTVSCRNWLNVSEA